MKAPVAYTYVILNERRRSTARWSLAIQFPNGILSASRHTKVVTAPCPPQRLSPSAPAA